jgi:hypothetical protein
VKKTLLHSSAALKQNAAAEAEDADNSRCFFLIKTGKAAELPCLFYYDELYHCFFSFLSLSNSIILSLVLFSFLNCTSIENKVTTTIIRKNISIKLPSSYLATTWKTSKDCSGRCLLKSVAMVPAQYIPALAG